MNQTALHFLAGIGALSLVLSAGYGVHALRSYCKRRRADRNRIEYLTPRLVTENARRDKSMTKKTVRLAPLAKSELPPGYWPTPKMPNPPHPNIY